jgi:hypothetical protein
LATRKKGFPKPGQARRWAIPALAVDFFLDYSLSLSLNRGKEFA